jgi:2-polyprenyl-6-methoxyphenol hydroxylase-like FAD-dependent oxidoreductase
LIAGGGLVGLCAAAFLAKHGIPSLTIERLPQSSPLPRAAFFHMRTLEMFRWLDIERAVREASARDFVPEGSIVALESIAGRKLADIMPSLNEGVEALSPCRRLYLNQPTLEPILRERARMAGATIVQGTEVQDVRQDAQSVHVVARDLGSGQLITFRGSYLIAADGGRSKVRETLGVHYRGRGAFSNSVTIYFTADLSPWLAHRAWSIIYINNPILRGFFRMNRSAQAGFLAVNVIGDPQAEADATADLSEANLVSLVRAGIGVADLPVRIDGWTRWRAQASVADRFQDGRIFIAGDAAHLMPPNGGFGGNTGIHDVHNLAWKLALVIRGGAPGRLLETYAAERQPIAEFTVGQAFTRYVLRTAPWLAPTQTVDPQANDFDVELGYLYGVPGKLHADPHDTRGMPGSRAPHVWIRRSGARISTLDLFGNYCLLTGPDGSDWIHADLPLDNYQAGVDFDDHDDRFCEAFGLSATGASLIRPDGFVAWRSESLPPDPETMLRRALESSLGVV